VAELTEEAVDETLSRTQPFPGLRPYDEADASWFFGRSAEINDLLKRLRRLHFVAIVGASGSGKSSLIRAGVLPQIRDGYLDAEWQIATFRPGEQPMRNLAEALGPEFGSTPEETLDLLRKGPSGLVRTVARVQGNGGRLLLVVDQFEELFQFAQRTGDRAQEEIKEFLKLLLTAASSDDVAVYVVVTMRLEWLNECVSYAGLAEAINEGIYLVPQMQRRQFGQAILGPLESAGGMLTSALLDRMLNDLDNKSDQLPVLQHALLRLWVREGAREPFDLNAYEAVGTFSNCLSAHAEEVYAELTARQRQIAEHLFRSITQVNKNRKIRRPRPVNDLLNAPAGANGAGTIGFTELSDVITVFRRPGRSFLVTTQGALAPASIVDISHEALIRQWTRLSKWVEDEAELQARLGRLEEDAAEWNRDRTHSKACLYGGSRLMRAKELEPVLDPASVAGMFLKESSRANFWLLVRRRGWLGLVALLLVGVAFGLAFLSSERAKELQASAQLAEAQKREAESEASMASLQARKAQKFQANLVQQIDAAKGSATALAAIAQNIQAERVYVQYASGGDLLASSLQSLLQRRGFTVPSSEQISSDRSPGQTQVRYFHSEDRSDAQRIAGLLKPLLAGGVAVEAIANPKDVVPTGQFEVWVSSPAVVAPEAGNPATATNKQAPTGPSESSLENHSSPAAAALAPVLTASLSQDHVQQGHGVTLIWHSENAQSVQLEGVGNVEPNGSMTMTPQQTTTYRLVARGDGGSTSKSVSVEVIAAPAASLVPVVNQDQSDVKAALNRYKEAFESESMDDLRRAWPTMSKAQEKNTSFVFSQFNAIRLNLNCSDDQIQIDGQTANATCRQTAVYTQKGKRQPEQANTASFRLRKLNGNWVVDAVK